MLSLKKVLLQKVRVCSYIVFIAEAHIQRYGRNHYLIYLNDVHTFSPLLQ